MMGKDMIALPFQPTTFFKGLRGIRPYLALPLLLVALAGILPSLALFLEGWLGLTQWVEGAGLPRAHPRPPPPPPPLPTPGSPLRGLLVPPSLRRLRLGPEGLGRAGGPGLGGGVHPPLPKHPVRGKGRPRPRDPLHGQEPSRALHPRDGEAMGKRGWNRKRALVGHPRGRARGSSLQALGRGGGQRPGGRGPGRRWPGQSP